MNFSGIPHRTILGRVLRFPLQLLPSSTQMPILQGSLRGRRWIVGSSNHGCWLGSYEQEKQKAFSAAVKRGDTVYDLGANVGFYSLLASGLVGPSGRVISFEPVPRNLDFLRRHMELNGVTNCSVLNVAVGRFDGTASFDTGPNTHMGHLSDDLPGDLNVRVVALDNLVASGELPPPNLIKCDIEGGEYDALVGAARTLAMYGPTIFLATHGSEVHRQCCEFLTDLHYQLSSLEGVPQEQSSEILAIRQETVWASV